MIMKKIIHLLLLCLVTLLSVWIFGCGKKSTGSTGGSNKTLTVRIVHSPVLGELLEAAKDAFTKKQVALPDGTLVKIELISELGLTAAQKIATGAYDKKPHAWLAPSTSLISYTNGSRVNLGPKQVNCLQLFGTPVVLGVSTPNWKIFSPHTQEISWGNFIKRRQNPALNRFEGGSDTSIDRISYSHTVPTDSTSGLAALTQLAYFASPAPDGVLVLEALRAKASRRKINLYESLVSKFTTEESQLLKQVALSTPNRMQFVITTEQQIVNYNKRNNPKIVALYPKEGSYWDDYNLCVSEADWVSTGHHLALQKFSEFLASAASQKAAKRAGFRPAQSNVPEPGPLTKKMGVDVSLPAKSFKPVSGEVINYLIKNWPDWKSKAATVFVLDTSGSMEGERISIVQREFRKLIAKRSEGDKSALITFSSTPEIVMELTEDRAAIINSIDTIRALGGSAMYDSILEAFKILGDSRLRFYRKSIFVLTDGDDKNSTISFSALRARAKELSAKNDVELIILGINNTETKFEDLRELVRSVGGSIKTGNAAEIPALISDFYFSL